MGPILVDKTVFFLFVRGPHIDKMCDGKTFSTKDIKNPTSRLVAQLTCQLEPTQGGALLSTTLFTIYLGWGGGGGAQPWLF